MSKLPTVAIIGRPNTGKSTLFNRLVGSRRAIESEVAGTTRDIIAHRIDGKIPYMLLDTGGLGSTDDKEFEADVRGQSKLALEHADVIVLTVNAREDITLDDQRIVEMLRKSRKRPASAKATVGRKVPVIVAVTKADNPQAHTEPLANYQEMNVGDAFIAVSAPHRIGIGELCEAIESNLGKLHFSHNEATQVPSPKSQVPRIAIIGRPNVGKSSIVNAMMSDAQREELPLLVSPVAGTTRDSTDTEVKFHDRTYILVDTAGLKKKSQNLKEVERFSMFRTISAIENADVVVLVLDAQVEVSQQDKRIASMAVESGKGLIVLANKIDGIKGDARKQRLYEISVHLQFCKFAPIIPCSAITREGLVKLFDMVEMVQRNRVRRITTRELHRWFEQVVHGQPLGEIGKTKHITQGKEIPPTFVLFVKDARRVSVSQLRYLENRIRETFGFAGVPIRWVTKSAPKKEGRMIKR